MTVICEKMLKKRYLIERNVADLASSLQC